MSLLAAATQVYHDKIRPRVGSTTIAAVLGGAGVAYYLRRSWLKASALQAARLREDDDAHLVIHHVEAHEGKKKVAVDRAFLTRLQMLLPIVLPSWHSKEALLLGLHTAFLVARTFVSIYVARLDGSIVKSIVDRNAWGFAWRMSRWLLIAIPATYINSMIRYLESKLSIAFRTRLVDYVYSLYMHNDTYYRVNNVDSRLQNPDQCITEDVARFCSELAHLYSQISKPIFDIVLMCLQLILLARARSGSGMQLHYPWLLATAVVSATFFILKWATPPFGKLVAEETRRSGVLRAVHARLIAHSEEIAFYGGHKIEASVLRRAYTSLVSHMNYIYKQRIWYTMLEQFLMKYVWSASGLVMIAIPTLIRDKGKYAEAAPKVTHVLSESEDPVPTSFIPSALTEDTVSSRTEDFVTARGLLTSAADAMERLMSSWKEITELAGHTYRVAEMMKVFREVSDGKYVKTLSSEAKHALEARGEVLDNQSVIRLEDVPVTTPNGDVLVERLSFSIEPGMHLLITGPNGCGKSSLFRMLGGLWSTHGGRMLRPAKTDMFYIPQKPYLSAGTLRDQFIYPDSLQDMQRKGLCDDDLLGILSVVNLAYIVEREQGWDAINDWRDVLSGGEKQRVGMARLFYHRPKYAILDECTSAVSIDVEGQMYLHAKKLGITLMTVTHRPSLWQYHTHLLQFDGQGNYKFAELNAKERLTLQEEKARLEVEMASMPKRYERLQELCALLGEDSIHLKVAAGAPTVPATPPLSAEQPEAPDSPVASPSSPAPFRALVDN